MSTDDVVVRLRLADVARFIADVKSGKRSIDDLEKSVQRAGNTAHRVSGPSHLGLMQATIGRLKYAVAGLTFVFGSAAVGAAKFALSSTASLEQVQIGFTTMLKSKSAAVDLVKELQNFSDWSPFVDQDVNRWAQSLVGFGVKASQVIPTLTALGNQVSGMGLSPDEVSGTIRALEQIAGKGRLMATEMLQLQDHMVFAGTYLKKGLGMTDDQFKKAQETGSISSSVAIPLILKGMQDQYKGSMEAQSKTIAGLWSTLKSKVARALTADPDSPFASAVRSWLSGMIADMPAIQTWMRKWFSRVWDFGGDVKDAVANAKAATQKVMDQVKGASGFGGWMTLGSSAGGATATTGASLVDGLLDSVSKIDWFDAGQSVGSNAVGFILGFIGGLLDFTAYWPLIKKHWWDIILVIISLVPFGKAIGSLGKLLLKVPFLKAFAPMFLKAGAAMEKAGGPIWDLMKKIGNAIFKGFRQIFPRTAEFLMHGLPKMLRGGSIQLRKLGGDLGAILHDGFFGSIQLLAKGFFWALRRLGHMIKDLLWRPITLILGPGLTAVLIKGWETLKGWFTDFKTWLQNLFKDVVNFFIDGINRALSHDVMGRTIGVTIPRLAGGGTATRAGTAMVGERGPELLHLSRGASVIPLQRIPDFDFTGMAGDRVTVIQIDGREVARAVHKAEDTTMARA